MKIVVLCGGLSMERDVSISSGTLVCKALRASGHQAVLVDMFYGLDEYDGEPAALFENLPEIKEVSIVKEEPDLDAIRASRKWQSPSMIGKGVLELCQLADVVFLALHGTCGEDGRIQATLDLMGVKYTGSGYLGSAIAMDKDLTKQLAQAVGVRTPDWRMVEYDGRGLEEIADGLFLPCVVKPVDSGSSIGVSIVHTREELIRALKENEKLGRVMVEQYISGREIDIGILEDKALPSIEIIPKHGFYDYANKYQAGAALEICPAEIPAELEKELGELTLKVHRALKLGAYSRSDFKLDEEGNVYFIEINTLPGMTPTSLMPQEAAAIGVDYQELCERIVQLAVDGGKA